MNKTSLVWLAGVQSGSKPNPKSLRLTLPPLNTKSFFPSVEDLQRSQTLQGALTWPCATVSIFWLTCIFQGILSLGFSTSKMFDMHIN